MRTGIAIELDSADRGRLEALLGGRNTPQKDVWRAEILHFLSADRVGINEITRRTVKSKTTVWR